MKSKVFASLFSLLVCFISTAQSRKVSGRVTKEGSSDSLAAVTVSVKGGKASTLTDQGGRFIITVPNNNTVLVFSSVGFANTELAVRDRTSLDVTMSQESSTLNDVVVIGYGTARKKDLTGATASLAGSTLEKIPLSSAAEAMTGRLAGVQVTTTDGAPGAEIVIRVRGGGSVTQDNSPLYIVDGFPVGSINDIAPTDISSIDILKDASSTAIYGARGANGVVIITTKSAKGGKTTVSFNSFVQTRQLPKELEVLSPYEFALVQYEYARIRSQAEVDNFSKYFGVYEDLELYKNQVGTNWQDVLFGSSGQSQQHNLSITGGTDKTKMSFSMSNNKDQGLQPGSAYQRTYLNFKLNHELYKGLKLDLTSRYTNTNIDGAGTSGGSSVRIGDGITTRPINGLADQIEFDPLSAGTTDDEYEQFIKSLVGPVALTAQDYRKSITKAFNMNAGASWNITKKFLFRSELGIDLRWANNKRFYGPLTGESKTNGNSLPVGEIRNNRTEAYRWANTLTYSHKKGDHDMNFLVGQEINAGKVATDYTRAENFAENLLPERIFSNMALGVMDQFQTFEGPGDNLASVFGRANYQYKGKYILTATARYDGSLKFAPGKQWGMFPAFAAAWRVSDEDFMKNSRVISELKFRASYGKAGNNRIPNDLYRRVFNIQTNRPIGFGEVNQAYWGSASSILVNPDIRWETTITRNMGLDFGLFKNRLSGTLDVYYNSTPGLLVQSAIPPQTGYTSQIRNQGKTSNRGIELALTGTLVNTKDLQLSANFNIGVNKARIDDLGGPTTQSFNSNWAGTDLKSIDDYRLIVGETVGLMYGYVTDGMYTVDDFQSYDPVTRRYLLNKGVPDAGGLLGTIGGGLSPASFARPGTLKLKDLNGDGLITADDRTIIGSALPDYQGGFGLNGTYKGFDFSAFFNYVVGNDVYNTGKIQFNMLYRTTYGSMLNTMNSSNRFKYIDENGGLVSDLEALRTLNQNATIWSPFSMGTAAPVFHSYAVEDGSFLRLNNVSIGYSLPKPLISRIHMTRFRIYATVTNAFLWTKYSGYDPEVSATRNGSYTALTPGVDFSGYPKSRTFTIGANVTF
ncbi:TonB-dependent receptor [Segetibacter sp. 3557_3]|uniref:SusC/RagA family TonB-linked outer membrane protein n=1 Tax=Segetibacter sp. 3557_3 TaxID=2547429 RepID=UPI00105847D0|nr:TonB-dependent receptor [Segetibacter sp. 3557_3]TDH27766.1 TonB-dependent receptor [Segetibacter sp. 3557_3]